MKLFVCIRSFYRGQKRFSADEAALFLSREKPLEFHLDWNSRGLFAAWQRVCLVEQTFAKSIKPVVAYLIGCLHVVDVKPAILVQGD